jgi:hypothetical protein
MKVLSIDVGVHNMAFYIEEFNPDEITPLKLAKSRRYTPEGTPTAEWREILDRIYKNGKTVLHRRLDLSSTKGTQFRLEIFVNLSLYLDSISDLILDCDYILVEQQLSTNPMAQRIEQHIVSWVTFNYLDTKNIIIFPARHKTQTLGAPKRVTNPKTGKIAKMTKPQRKQWACDEAQHILNLRDDMAGLHYIFSENRSKRDDLSDVIVQLNAFKVKRFIDGVDK